MPWSRFIMMRSWTQYDGGKCTDRRWDLPSKTTEHSMTMTFLLTHIPRRSYIPSTSIQSGLTQWGFHGMASILQTFSNVCSSYKFIVSSIQFSFVFLEVQLTICQHWSRQWLGDEQAISQYLNQCWPSSISPYDFTTSSLVNIWTG